MNAEIRNLRAKQLEAFEMMKRFEWALAHAKEFGIIPYYPGNRATINVQYRNWKNKYNNYTKKIATKLRTPMNRQRFINNF
mgnify:CR=1 FL=1